MIRNGLVHLVWRSRWFTQIILAGALALYLAAAAPSTPAPPDVLFIAIDDMNDWTTLFSPGHPIRTPNLERLAARGVLFTRAYAPSAGCLPSRTAVLTGLALHTSGVYHNWYDFWRTMLPDAVTIPQYFASHGYVTQGAGKIFHDSDDSVKSFQEFFPRITDRVYAPERNYNGYPRDTPVGRVGYDFGAHDGKHVDDDMIAWVTKRLREHSAGPLFLAAGIVRPHLPFYAPSRIFETYPLERVIMPPALENDLHDVPAAGVELARAEHFLFETLSAAPPESPGSLRHFVRAYQAASTFADEQLGRLLDGLDASGRTDNTIIVVWSDHGYHLGDKRSCVKFTLWEKAAHVPLIIVAPGVTRPGTRCETPVNLLDVYPTLVDLAGLPARPELDGESLRPLLEYPDQRQARVAITTQGRMNHAVRSAEWRYIQYADGSEELYADGDPWNERNLAARPELAGVLAWHRQHVPKPGPPERVRPPR